jgi:tripartite-type tricarboxylate transporter receptor subunit TctC
MQSRTIRSFFLHTGCAAIIGLFVIPLAANNALAQDSELSMQGKTITIYVSVGAGGGYDAYGRMLGRFIGRHIPGNPTVIVSNMPGGGGHKLCEYMTKMAPKDGTALAIVQHTTVYDAVFGDPSVHYDPPKFNWIGSMASTNFVAVVWHTTGVKSIADLKKKEVSVGATGAGATSYQYPTLMNSLFGTKFKIISGYKSSAQIYHATEQRELDGTGGLAWEIFRNAHGDWIRDKKVNILVQYGLKAEKDLPNVPLILSLARTPQEKEILQFAFSGLQFAEPFFAPPGVSKERVKMLRTAFMAALEDPELLEEARRQRLEISPINGEEVQQDVADIFNAKQELKDRARISLTGK